jgi:hypothetical protein
MFTRPIHCPRWVLVPKDYPNKDRASPLAITHSLAVLIPTVRCECEVPLDRAHARFVLKELPKVPWVLPVIARVDEVSPRIGFEPEAVNFEQCAADPIFSECRKARLQLRSQLHRQCNHVVHHDSPPVVIGRTFAGRRGWS